MQTYSSENSKPLKDSYRVTSGMKNLKYLKNLKNLKKSGNFTLSQEKMHEKPEKVRIFTLVRKKSVFFLQFTIKSKIFACGAELYLNNITMIKDCLNILNIIF